MASKRSGIQLCYPFEEKRLEKWDPPYLVQPKLDGERCRAIITSQEDVLLVSSEKNIISSVPHINRAINSLNLPEGTELDGELYCHGLVFEEIHSIVGRTVNMHPDQNNMEFHIFDIIPVSDPLMIQGKRHLLIRDQLSLCPPLIKVDTHIAFTLNEVMKYYDYYIEAGYEGIIIRNAYYSYERKRSTGVMKFKPKKFDHYQIIDILEAIDLNGQPKNTLGAFLCQGSDGTPFNVGAGKLSHDERQVIWDSKEDYINLMCEVQYQNITNNGVPRFALCVKKPEEAAIVDPTNDFIKGLLLRR